MRISFLHVALLIVALAPLLGAQSTGYSGTSSWLPTNCSTQIQWSTTKRPAAVTAQRLLSSQYCTPQQQMYEGPVWVVPNGTTMADLGLSLTFADLSGTTRPLITQQYWVNGWSETEWVGGPNTMVYSAPHTITPSSGSFQDDWVTQILIQAFANYTFFELPLTIISGTPANGGSQVQCEVRSGGALVTAPLVVRVGSSVSALNLSLRAIDPSFTWVSVFLHQPGSGFGINPDEFELGAYYQAVAPASTPTGVFSAMGTYNLQAFALAVLQPSGGYFGAKYARVDFTIEVIADPRIEIDDSGFPVSHGDAASHNRDFGAHDLSALPTSACSLGVSNSGQGDLLISTITISGTGANAFQLDLTGTNLTVAQGSGTSFTVRFAATSVGLYEAMVRIEHNDPTVASPFEFQIRGQAVSVPELELSDADGIISHGSAAGSDRSFSGDVAAMPAAHACVVQVRNTSSATLTLSVPQLVGLNASEFALDLAGFSSTLAWGAVTSFRIQFHATTIGSKSAMVTLTHDDPSQPSPFEFALAGLATSSASIQWQTLSLPAALQNSPYGPVALVVTGGGAPYTFTQVAGTLPQGMIFDSAGVLSGTPLEQGDFSLDVQVRDVHGVSGGTQRFNLHVEFDALSIARQGSSGGGGCTAGTQQAILPVVCLMVLAILARRIRKKAA